MTTERLSLSRWSHPVGLFASVVLFALYARIPQAWPLGFVGLVPWLLALNRLRSLRGALLSAAVMSMAFTAAVFSWFGAAIGAYTGMGAGLATAVLLLLAPVLQLQILAFALVRYWVGRHHGPVLRALAAASAWVACEWWIPKLLGDTLGHGLFASAMMRQAADLGGAAGLTLLLLLVNEALAVAAERRAAGPRAVLRPLAVGLAVLLGTAGYGMVRNAELAAPSGDASPALRIAMVQANITDYERLRREQGSYAVVRHVLDTHYALSVSAIRDHGADALLWSETVYPTTFGTPRSEDGAALDREIQGFVDAMGVPLVFGTYDVDAKGEYNAAAFLEPGKGRLGTYRKSHPFPLTEYVPRWLDGPWLRRLLPWTGSWQPGDGARVLPLRSADGREVNVVPLICLDDVRTDLAIAGARLGAQAIVGMSNDSWFTGQPVGARLHLAVAAFRSIETRLPQVRVTTNGLSAIIDPTGKVVATTQMGQQAVLTASVPAQDAPATLMVRWGDWVGRAATWFLLGLLGMAAFQRLLARRGQVADAPLALDVAVLSPPWRVAAAMLWLCAGVGLVWLAMDMAFRVGWQVQSLSQLWRFAGAVVMPAMASWMILQAFKGQARIDGEVLVLDQRHSRIEIPLESIASLRIWRMPLPGSGVDLRLASGRRLEKGLVLTRPRHLRDALTAAGRQVPFEGRIGATIAGFVEARGLASRPRMDSRLLKFLVFPLLPALVAFRLHQVIAFGGAFGEYYTYGALAWLTGLLIWWASWAIGLMLFAALLRVLIEAACLSVHMVAPGRVTAVRDTLEWAGRVAFYVGVPAWLILRLASNA